MKLSDGFDARRLRDRTVPDWRWISAYLGFVLIFLCGLACCGFAAFVLTTQDSSAAIFSLANTHSYSLCVTGLSLSYCSGWFLLRARRRRKQHGKLSLAPHLLRKSN